MLLRVHRCTHDCRFCCVRNAPRTCYSGTCVFSVCLLAVCVLKVCHENSCYNPHAEGVSSCCALRVCVFPSSSVPLSHLPHHPFPLLSLLLFQPPVGPNCHQESKNPIFALDGVGRGSNDTINLIPRREAGLNRGQ